MKTSAIGDIGGYIDENWHGGQIDDDMFSHPSFDIAEEKQEKKEQKVAWNWRHAMTRELMRGNHKNEILFKYKDAISKFGVQDEVSEFLNENDGIIGWFVVDVSNFDSKFSYDDMPEMLRKCNLYAMNATELREIISRSLVSENNGSLDGFLNSDDSLCENVSYIDEITGLPCIDGLSEKDINDDERLLNIAWMFIGKRWMDEGQMAAFNVSDNKFGMLVDAVRKSQSINSNATGEYTDDAKKYDVQDTEVKVEPVKKQDDIKMTGIRQRRLDDIGTTKMPDKFDIKQETRKSDLKKDIDLEKKPLDPVKVDRLKEKKVDDIGETGIRKDLVMDGPLKEKKVDDIGDVDPVKAASVEDDPDRPADIDVIEIETDGGYGAVDDDMSELGAKALRPDFDLSDVSGDFVIEDVKDMRDDEFDYGDVSDGNVDIDEMMEEDADKNDLDINKVNKDIEISDKYDWSW